VQPQERRREPERPKERGQPAQLGALEQQVLQRLAVGAAVGAAEGAAVGALAFASAISASVSTIKPMVSPTGAVLPAGINTAAR